MTIEKHHILMMSFFVPSFILLLSYAVIGVFPFSGRNILTVDMYFQYAPFISDLQDKLTSFSSLLYSWSGGLGINYLPLFAYYLASPINLLTVLFPPQYITEAILAITLIKVGLAGAAFNYFLRKVYGDKDLSTVAFSSLYALSGFVLAYSWNIMWLDSIYLLPLVAYGLIRLVKEGRGLFYCIVLAAALITNFYMAFFICIFMVFYFIVTLFRYHGIRKPMLLIGRTVSFAGYSLLSGGLSAFILLPTFNQLGTTSAAGDTFPKTIKTYYDIFDFIVRHFLTIDPVIRDGAPNLYSGIAMLILVPMYFLVRRIPLKEKLLNLSLLIFLIVSFNINILNFIWHGFHFPNQLPYRFSFVYIFLVLTMAYEGYKALDEFSGKQVGILSMAVLLVILISQKFEDIKLPLHTVYVSAAFIILYAAAFARMRSSNARRFKGGSALIMVLALELLTNTIVTVVKIDSTESYSSREGYSSGTEVREIREQISMLLESDRDFYRIEVIPHKTQNDPSLYNYPGVSVFASTISEKPVDLMEELGLYSNGINSYVYSGSTLITDSLFGIRYLFYRELGVNEKLYSKVSDSDEIDVLMNPYSLSPGFMTKPEVADFKSSIGRDPLDSQRLLFEAFSGVEGVLQPIDQEVGETDNLTISGTSRYSYTRSSKESDSTAVIRMDFDESGQVYLYYDAPSSMKGKGSITVNGVKSGFDAYHSSVISLGYCEAGTSAEVLIEFDKSGSESGRFEIYSYSMDLEAFEEGISEIRKNQLEIESFSDTSIRGTVNSDYDGMMVMSIPYDKGWNVTVDGKKVETTSVDESLLSFEVPEGIHAIRLTFFTDKLAEGIGITAISASIMIFLIIRHRKSDFKQQRRDVEDNG
jgi:uncharacterized membrane protein YfhO